MYEATLAKAMDPFFTTKEPGKETGLGLPILHGLAQQSGGRLLLKSRKREGTTAELWLPIAKGCSAPVPSKAAESAAKEKPNPLSWLWSMTTVSS
jgi:nitrogen-specific signal transduction histidine kinase